MAWNALTAVERLQLFQDCLTADMSVSPAGPYASVPLWTGAERDWSRIKDSIRISGCSVGNVTCWVPVPRGLFVDYSWDGLEPIHEVLSESAL